MIKRVVRLIIIVLSIPTCWPSRNWLRRWSLASCRLDQSSLWSFRWSVMIGQFWSVMISEISFADLITDDHFDDHWWSDNFNRLQTWSLIDQNRSVNISQFWSIFQTWSLFDDLTLSFSDRQNLARETYLWLDVYSDEEICEQFDISNIDVKAK